VTLKRVRGERFSLARWSRRKLESALEKAASAAPEPTTPVPAASAAPAPGASAPPGELPPVESLTFDSDFTPFLRPDVEAGLKRSALKQLFRDPRFNVMDGLDVYIDDYTKADPIPTEMLSELIDRFEFRDTSTGAPAPAPAATAEPAVAQGEAPRVAETESVAQASTAAPGGERSKPPAIVPAAAPDADDPAAAFDAASAVAERPATRDRG
jgi:hypothetical protein